MLIPFLYLLTSTVSPGPVTVLTIHNTSKHGRLPGMAVAFGGAVTTAVFAAIALMLTTNSYLSDMVLMMGNPQNNDDHLLVFCHLFCSQANSKMVQSCKNSTRS